MKKESNRNRTQRTAVALALLLAFAAPQALRGNLGIYAPTCGSSTIRAPMSPWPRPRRWAASG